jgi:hypothetical protein
MTPFGIRRRFWRLLERFNKYMDETCQCTRCREAKAFEKKEKTREQQK